MALRVIHTLGSLGFSAGGPSRTVPALCRHVTAADRLIQCEIVTSHDRRHGMPMACPDLETHAVAHGAGSAALEHLLAARVAHAAATDDTLVLHDHGQWLPINRFSATAARRMAVSRVVSPRGMLTPWSMNHKRMKKKAAWLLFARRDFAGATVVHATSQDEADELRALGARQPIALIPNGIDHRDLASSSGTKTKTVVFLSRIHPKKGVAELVSAWRALKPPGWRLILAGPDEARMIDSLRLSAGDAISYVGEVDGDAKWHLLSTASATVLPSYSENFGVVVAESLVAGTPVIATEGTPWSILKEHRCGWWIPMTPQALADALQTATRTDLECLAMMGERGHALALSRFTWPAIGRQMADVYRWLADDSGIPPCVQIA